MTEAVCVLVKCEVGREVETVEQFRRLNRVQAICAVIGPYDYLLKIERENMKEIGDTIARQLRQIPGVNDTVTMVVIGSHL